MRITRFIDGNGQLRAGVDRGDGTADLFEHPDAVAPEPPHLPTPTGRIANIAARRAPVAPVNIFCIGANYRAHIEETGAKVPERPVVFMKPVTAVNHHARPIRLPACSPEPEVDYEVELAVIIGRAGRDIPEAEALDHVLGYTVANDVSARWWQKHGGGGQWVRGKGFDSFCPLGPVLVTADEIPDPQQLTLRTTLNGRVMQESSTADMLFSVAELIAFLSQDTTLLPGTVILTGTPEGVGMGRDPRVYLKAGDEVTVEIASVGRLTNAVVGPKD